MKRFYRLLLFVAKNIYKKCKIVERNDSMRSHTTHYVLRPPILEPLPLDLSQSIGNEARALGRLNQSNGQMWRVRIV